MLKKIIKRLKETGLKATCRRAVETLNNIRQQQKAKHAVKQPIKFRTILKNYIVFECESDMDDNPRAVYDYLIKNNYNNKYKLIWIVKNISFCKKNYAEKNVVFLSRYNYSLLNRIRLGYYLSSAKWFIFSHPYWYKKYNKKQIIINIWHGCPMKDTEKKPSYNSKEVFDYFLSTSAAISDWNLKALHCTKDMEFLCGYPRNDLLFNIDKDTILNKLIKYNVSDKIIMCMPTYKQSARLKDSTSTDSYVLSVIET